MVEFRRLFQRLIGGENTPPVKTPLVEPLHALFNPAAEPDVARREVFKIPGVLNGTLPLERLDGVEVIDFDHRDEYGNFKRIFYPGADISDFIAK